jgi:hypothetical protein
VRSWEEAINFAQKELDAAGDLEGRLDRTAETAIGLSAKIDLLDQARPALELIAQLRDVNIPLIGSGWQILLLLLSLATVDGAKIIAKLEEILRSLSELKGSLDGLSSLPSVATAVREFRAEPNRRTLVALAMTSSGATPSMRQLHGDLGEVLDPLKDVAGGMSGLVGGLQSAAEAGIPAVSDTARLAAERIGLIEEPLLTLRDGLDRLHQSIAADANTLERIQEAVRQAREYND